MESCILDEIAPKSLVTQKRVQWLSQVPFLSKLRIKNLRMIYTFYIPYHSNPSMCIFVIFRYHTSVWTCADYFGIILSKFLLNKLYKMIWLAISWINHFSQQLDMPENTNNLIKIFNILLTHWGWDKMAAIFQTTFSNGFSWMKMYEFRLTFHWSLFLGVQLTIFQHRFR